MHYSKKRLNTSGSGMMCWDSRMNNHALMQTQFLYGIVDTGYVAEGDYGRMIRLLAEGGVKLIQFRAKGRPEEFVRKNCLELAPLCRELGVVFIVNDYPYIAAECEAGGVHVGQDDGRLDDVRAIVGEKAVIGRSTHSCEQAVNAWKEGADYIGFGPLFPTATKPGRPAIGLEEITLVHRSLPQDFPVYCIGGVQPDRLDDIMKAGAKRVVIVSWLLNQPDIPLAAAQIRRMLG